MSASSDTETSSPELKQTEPVLESFAEAERKQLLDLFLKHRGNKTRMAQELGISRTTLYSRIRKYGL